MLKLPTGAELKGLFFSPSTVAQAIRGIEAAAAGAERVSVTNYRKGTSRLELASYHEDAAHDHREVAAGHATEALRAVRVAGKLRALVA